MWSLLLRESVGVNLFSWLRLLNNSGVLDMWGVFQGAGFLGLTLCPLKQILEN